MRPMEALEEEFGDRFGPLPVSVENLFFQASVKILGGNAGLASITRAAKPTLTML